MTQTWQPAFGQLLHILIALGGLNIQLPKPLLAQIIPDNTLGNENSLVNSIDEQVHLIEGGAIRDSNLFHSFFEFNIGEGNSAYFANPAGIANIFSRITGSNPSDLMGTLGVLGNANLFFLNPNGIIFGPNARLDVSGSFVGSTASRIIFPDGITFSTTNPQAPPLLTVNVQQPIGLRFEGQPGTIINQSRATDSNGQVVGLRVEQGQSLGLLGGEIKLEGGVLTAEGGRIELGSIAGQGLVSLNQTTQGLVLGYDEVQNLGNIQLSQEAIVDASGEGGGEIQVKGWQISVTNGSEIKSLTHGSYPGKNIILNGLDSVEVSDNSEVSATTFGNGNGGNIKIETRHFLIADEAQISADTGFGSGQGGNLTVTAELVEVTNSSQLSTTTVGSGDAGNLTIQAKSVELIGPDSQLFALVGRGDSGNGGNIIIDTEFLRVADKGIIFNGTRGSGKGGDLTVRAKSAEILGFSVLSTSVLEEATGNGGNMTIDVERLLLEDGAVVLTTTFGSGNAGNLAVSAKQIELLGTTSGDNEIIPSSLTTQADLSSSGNGGNLSIETGNLLVRDGAVVTTSTLSSGKAGDLTIAAESVQLIGISANGEIASSLLADVGEEATGDGGNIKMETESLLVRDGGEISVATVGTGKAGNVRIETSSLILDNGTISAETASNTGGNITLQVQDLLLLGNSSQISTTAGTAQAKGDGGNITIDAKFILAVPEENSDITANAFFGNGGRISITANGIFGIEPRDRLTPLSDITSSSTFGLAGIVDINNPDVDPNQGLAKLQEAPEEVELAEGCQADDGQKTAAFFNIGRGGLPPTPEEPFSSETIIAPWIPLISEGEKDSEQAFSGSFTASGNQARIFRRIPCPNNSVSEPLN